MTTFHEILGTTKDSTTQEVKKRYKLLSAKCHPDKGGSNELFKLIKLAFDKVLAGYGQHQFFQQNDQEAVIEKQLRALITLLENERSKELNAKLNLNVELNGKRIKIEQLESELLQQSYKLVALEKKNNLAQKPSLNKKTLFSTVIMAILVAIAGYSVAERQYKDSPTYSINETNSISKTNTSTIVEQPPQEYKFVLRDSKDDNNVHSLAKTDTAVVPLPQGYRLFLGTFRNENNVKHLVKKLKESGYSVFIEQSNYSYRVIVSTHSKENVNTTIKNLQKLTHLRARIMPSGT
jgi:cell division septation protein DedD